MLGLFLDLHFLCLIFLIVCISNCYSTILFRYNIMVLKASAWREKVWSETWLNECILILWPLVYAYWCLHWLVLGLGLLSGLLGFYFRREYSVGVFFGLLPLPPSFSPPLPPPPPTCQLFFLLLCGPRSQYCIWGQDYFLCIICVYICGFFSPKLFCGHVMWLMPSSWAVVCLLICLQWRVFFVFLFSVHAMPGQVPKPCIPYPTHPGGSSPGSAVNAYSSFLDHCQSIQAQHGYDVVMARHTQIEMDHGT